MHLVKQALALRASVFQKMLLRKMDGLFFQLQRRRNGGISHERPDQAPKKRRN